MSKSSKSHKSRKPKEVVSTLPPETRSSYGKHSMSQVSTNTRATPDYGLGHEQEICRLLSHLPLTAMILS